MKVTTPDGRTFQGTALQIVRQMRALDMTSAAAASDADYMAEVARRAFELNGVEIRFVGADDEERASALLGSLSAAGLLDEAEKGA